MASEDDSDEDFAYHGTPLEPLEEDAPIKKPVSTEDQVVTDKQGRRRFHGAFTGGFSAGYFNTVSTPEGWTPATFVSSRSSKAGKVQQRPEDFMDDEDMGEFGIAPKTVSTTKEFLSEEKEDVRRKRAAAADEHSVLPTLLQDLIIPARESIGVKLLRKMGWRDGAGIGAKVKKKIKMKRQAEVAPSQKTYGCAPPPSHQHSEEDDSEDDPFAQGRDFAPKEVLPFTYQPKDNMHGIGYRGLTASVLGEPSYDMGRSAPRLGLRGKGGKGIMGQAFGVGAFEEEDDDIYTTDSMANYDFSAAGLEVENQTASKQMGQKHLISSAVEKAPEGFVLSARGAPQKKVFPPPAVPKDFKPLHKFSSTEKGEVKTGGRHSLTVLQRAQALGEKPPLEQLSVFDLISTADKEAIKTAQQQKPTDTAPTPVPSVSHTDRQTPSQSQQVTTPPLGHSFRPFSRDAAKQQRYEEYIRAAKSGAKDPMPATPSGMTEWEREREREEFMRAFQLYQPLHGMMASRFTRQKQQDQPITDQSHLPSQEKGDVSDQAKAAGMKMFGRLTRDRMEWHPDKLLCRRFNVPNPYPESTVVGLCTLKKEKYTFANFLSMPVESNSPRHPTASTAKPTETSTSHPNSQERAKASSNTAGGEERGVLSYLCESEAVPSTSGYDKGQEDVSKEQDKDEEKPPLDLFKAIFQSSSDSSGGSEESEEEEDEDAAEEDGVMRGEKDNRLSVSEPVRDKPVSAGGNITVAPAENEQLDKGPKLLDVVSPESHSRSWDKSGQEEQLIDTVEKEQFYGPALPPTVSGGVSTSPSRPLTEDPSSHRHKHSHRDKHRHKHKKDKKSKKSKHKHKKKSKKKRRWKDEGEESGSERESSEESEDEVKGTLLNDQLLHRVKSLRHHITSSDVL